MANFWWRFNKALVTTLLLGCCLQTLQAVTVSGLYKTTVPVASESATVQTAAFASALEQVLIKISGNSQIVSVSGINQALSNAVNYVQQYGYIEQAQNGQQQLMLNVTFTPAAINNLLRQSNQPIWGYNRPLLIAWVVVTDNQGTRVLTNNNLDPVATQLLQDAQDRGLPVILPTMDAVDAQYINPQVIQQNNLQVIQSASQRYQADGFFVANINATGAITSTWELVTSSKQQAWQVAGGTLLPAIKLGIDDISDALAVQYAVAVTPQTSQQIQMQVSNLEVATDYAKVQQYLMGLTGVTSVSVSSVNNDMATFNINLSSSLPAFVGQIKLGNRLLPVVQSTNNQQILSYQYNAS